jgi:putative SOS response-associated peptidase YedK
MMAKTSDTRDLFGGDHGGVDAGGGPGQLGRVLRLHSKTRERHLDWLIWGLLPHNTRDPDTAPRPIHARAETVAGLPMFADAFRHRRAIVPATEYYLGKDGTDERCAIVRRDGQPLAIAGLWEWWVSPTREVVRTYCIITVPANATVAPIHDRMPLILEPEDWAIWLGEEPDDPAQLLRPSADDVLVVRPTARRS